MQQDGQVQPAPRLRPGFLVGVVLFVVVAFYMVSWPSREAIEFAERAACLARLHEIDVAMSTHPGYQPANVSPTNPAAFPQLAHTPPGFICAGNRSQPGSFSNLVDRADYIYVIGSGTGSTLRVQSESDILPILICPPENHAGKGGCILAADHSTKWVPVPRIDSVLSNVLSPASGFTVVVSKRLTERAGGKYRSKP